MSILPRLRGVLISACILSVVTSSTFLLLPHCAHAGDHDRSATVTTAVSSQDATEPETLYSSTGASGVQLLGQIGGKLGAVAPVGIYAYVGEGPRLIVLDVSAPNTPIVVFRSIVLEGLVEDIVLTPGYAYVANGYGGLKVFNIATPNEPVLVTSVGTVGAARSIAVAGSTLFLIDDAGLSVFDIDDPAHPGLLGSFNVAGTVYDVAIADQSVVLLGERNGVRLLDATDRMQPVQLAFFETRGGVTSMYVAAPLVYLGVTFGDDTGAWLYVLDISTPAVPTKLSQMLRWSASYDDESDIVVLAGIAFLAVGGELQIVDVTDPTEPKTVYGPSVRADRLAAINQYLYAVDSFGRFSVLDIDPPTGARKLGVYQGLGNVQRVFGGSRHVYTSNNLQLSSIDTSNLSEPAILTTKWLYRVLDGFVRDEHVFVAYDEIVAAIGAWGQLLVLDAESLDEIGRSTIVSHGPLYGGVYATDDRAYLSLSSGGSSGGNMSVFEIDEPSNPTELHRTEIPGNTGRLTVQGNTAYVTSAPGGLHLLDVSAHSAPTLLHTYDLYDAVLDVAIRNSTAYIAAGADGVVALTVSDPQNPDYDGRFDTPSEATAIHVDANAIYVTDRSGGLRILGPSGWMSESAFFNTPGQAEDLFVDDQSVIYVADGDGGLYILHHPPCHTLTLAVNGEGDTPLVVPAESSGCPNGQFVAGEDIVLTAIPAIGWQVESWDGTDDDTSAADVNRVVMPATEHTVQVTYSQRCYVLALAHEGNGEDPMATPDHSPMCPTGTFVLGETIQLTAVPDEYWQVDEWIGADPSTINSTAGLTMPAHDDMVRVVYVPQQPQIRFDRLHYTTSESVASLEVGVRLSFPPIEPVHIHVASNDLTALAGEDYVETNLELELPPGQIGKTIEVEILDDNEEEAIEIFALSMSDPENALLDPTLLPTVYVYIEDDDVRSASSVIRHIATSTGLPEMILLDLVGPSDELLPQQYTLNGGANWQEVATTPWMTRTIGSLSIEIAPRLDNTPRFMVFVDDVDMVSEYRSGDGGIVWAKDDIVSRSLTIMSASFETIASAAAPARIYLTTCETVFSHPNPYVTGNVMTSNDSGITWNSACGERSWLDACPLQILPSPVLPDQYYFQDTLGWQRSDDGGKTCIGLDGFPAELALDAIDDRMLYGLRPSGTSIDGGATWIPWTTHPSDHGRLLAHPTKSQTIFLFDDGLYRSDDAGTTWQLINSMTGGFIAPDYGTPGRILWANGACLWGSADDGVSWRLLKSDCLPNSVYIPLVYDASKP